MNRERVGASGGSRLQRNKSGKCCSDPETDAELG